TARFVDEQSRPLARVHVDFRLGNCAPPMPTRGVTGEDGRFGYDVDQPTPVGSFQVRLTAACPGRATRFVPVDIETGKTTNLGDVALQPTGIPEAPAPPPHTKRSRRRAMGATPPT